MFITLLVFLLAACAGSGGAALRGDAPAALPGGDTTGGAQGDSDAGDGEAPADNEPDEPDAVALADDRLIVRTGRLDLEVQDVAATVERADELVERLGGYVSESEQRDDEGRATASVTYRIPSERWNDALRDLRALGARVIGEETEALEVTDQVVDLRARIANLRATEAAIQAIMERAGTIREVLEVQQELTEVRGEIERLVAQQDSLEQRAALGTLTVTFAAPVVALAEATEGWSLSAELDRAVAQLAQIGQGFASFGIWFLVVALPVLVPLTVLAVVGSRLYGRWAAARPPRRPDPLWGPGAPPGA